MQFICFYIFHTYTTHLSSIRKCISTSVTALFIIAFALAFIWHLYRTVPKLLNFLYADILDDLLYFAPQQKQYISSVFTNLPHILQRPNPFLYNPLPLNCGFIFLHLSRHTDGMLLSLFDPRSIGCTHLSISILLSTDT
jgi:hypothetical protein